MIDDFTPFNVWQMRNCAGCAVPEPCERRASYVKVFGEKGSIALIRECPLKVIL
jgi:hypothetical protein